MRGRSRPGGSSRFPSGADERTGSATLGADGYAITLTSGQTDGGNDFGNCIPLGAARAAATSSTTSNGDGIWQKATEPGLRRLGRSSLFVALDLGHRKGPSDAGPGQHGDHGVSPLGFWRIPASTEGRPYYVLRDPQGRLGGVNIPERSS